MRDRAQAGYSKMALVAVLAVFTFGVAALLVNIFEHKQAAKNPFYRVVEITDETEDPEVWGKNFPLQFDGYRRTVDMIRTRFGGSEAVPRVPTQADPRSLVAQSRIEEDPRLKIMWAGYAFAKDFREERGHAFMLEDQTFTERQQAAKQPGACVNCHASMYLPFKKAGEGDLQRGFDKINALPYAEARKLVSHPIACIDCHDPKTLQLRVTRPAFMKGIAAVKAAEGIEDYKVNEQATRQEMRSYVCGQCHVEYYFKGSEKTLTYPWDKGLKADEIYEYYRGNGHKDWEHALSGAPVLKAQHPEFELYNQGVHARSGVACADCHMPYERVGALKISDHHVRSPLLNINNACQTCHRFAEEELKQRVEAIQEKTAFMRGKALDALVELIQEAEAARKAGSPALTAASEHQRRAQFLLDFVEAENSMGFHAPQESARLLLMAMDDIRKGQLALRQPAEKAEPGPS